MGGERETMEPYHRPAADTVPTGQAHEPESRILKPPRPRSASRSGELRLVGDRGVGSGFESIGDPIGDPTDPRWVLAVRTASELQGPVLVPNRREKLVRLGRSLGLSPFHANMVIAIIQDQARRGLVPESCLKEAEPQLRMVPLPRAAFECRRPFRLVCAVACVIGLELLVLAMIL